MSAPVSLAEVAVVNSTGERVQVLRRRSINHDAQIMTALEAAGYAVIGVPQAFRYKHPDKPRFVRMNVHDVFLLDVDHRVTAIVPRPYFTKHYTILGSRP